MPKYKPNPIATHECFWCKNTRSERELVQMTLFRERRWVCNWKYINDCNSPGPAVQSYQ